MTGSFLEKVRGEGGQKHCASTGRCHNGTVKTSLSIYPCLPHHCLPWGDPKGRFLHIRAPAGETCKSFWCCYCPIISLPCPCRRFLLLQHRESKALPCRVWHKSLPSSPFSKPPGFPSSAHGVLLCQLHEGVVSRG